MNQGELEVVKQEITRMNIDFLGISELRWTRMAEFNSDDHYIYYCGQESLRRNGVAIMVNKRVQNAVLGCNLKNRMISVCFQGKPFQYSCLESPMNSMKRQRDRTLKDELPRSAGAQYATGDQWRNNSRKNEGMESKQNNTQLWMGLVIEARFNVVRRNIA